MPDSSNITRGAIWIHSDHQLRNMDAFRTLFEPAIRDMRSLAIPLTEIWCLGDILIGSDESSLDPVAERFVSSMESFDVPLVFLMGNHDLDTVRDGVNRHPLYDRVAPRSNWQVAPSIDAFYFERRVLGCRVVFFTDHADTAGRWWVTHGRINGDAAAYPYTPKHSQAIRRALEQADEPVLSVSHYAFPGGQRPSEMMNWLQPLPDNIVTHLHGHAHIGDVKHVKQWPFRRRNPIDGHDIHQYNISAIESYRSPDCHSALLLFENAVPVELHIRCHLQKRWVGHFSLQSSRDKVTSPPDVGASINHHQLDL